MKPIVFASQSATGSRRTERLMHDLLERRLPDAFRAMNRPDLAGGVFFDRVEQRNRMNEIIRQAAVGSAVGLLLHTTKWQASAYVREHELPHFDPTTFHEHGRHAVGVMFDPSELTPGEINRYLRLDRDGAGGMQWLRHDGKAYSELGDVGRRAFEMRIARVIGDLVPAAETL